MIALDTNLRVRLLTDDDPRQAAIVEAWLRDNASARAPAYIDHIMLCELAWVLERGYAYARDAVHQAIGALLEQDQLKVESSGMVRQALGLFEAGRAIFWITCWLCGVSVDGVDKLYFVVETKSTLHDDALRDAEAAKIACGREHFAALGSGADAAKFVRTTNVSEFCNHW